MLIGGGHVSRRARESGTRTPNASYSAVLDGMGSCTLLHTMVAHLHPLTLPIPCTPDVYAQVAGRQRFGPALLRQLAQAAAQLLQEELQGTLCGDMNGVRCVRGCGLLRRCATDCTHAAQCRRRSTRLTATHPSGTEWPGLFCRPLRPLASPA